MNIIDKFSMFYVDLASMKIDGLANIYRKDVVFIDPIAQHQGLDAVERYFTRLLGNAKFCKFTIHSKAQSDEFNATVSWTMSYTSSKLNSGRPIDVDGVTVIKIENNMIVYHRDYYDLGQMVYEHIPILGRLISKIKRTVG
ncbi:nuclear transport factor 2 family protein [Agaribacter flavus]|uniref:Nuclear transport factor 2 family protein n=1 Tax=Agaribacter flavus TaxID=1902781 RepID=A0ABV7FS26_9ALTE